MNFILKIIIEINKIYLKEENQAIGILWLRDSILWNVVGAFVLGNGIETYS